MRTALIFGRGCGVWDEVAQAQSLCKFDLTIAVGSAGVDYPGHIDAWVSFHIDLLPYWSEERMRRGRSRVDAFWTAIYKGSPIVARQVKDFPVRRVRCDGGSSGLVAVVAARDDMQVDRIVLAGIPMDPQAGQYDRPGYVWADGINYRKVWEEMRPGLRDIVRSMSGWTKETFGAPTRSWLAGRGVERVRVMDKVHAQG